VRLCSLFRATLARLPLLSVSAENRCLPTKCQTAKQLPQFLSVTSLKLLTLGLSVQSVKHSVTVLLTTIVTSYFHAPGPGESISRVVTELCRDERMKNKSH